MVLVFVCTAFVAADAQAPPRSVAAPQDEVRDLFLGYIVGIILTDHRLDVDGLTLLELFPEFEESGTRFPFHDISRVTRSSASGGATIKVEFTEPLSFPVPVDILGYHPGRIYTSQSVSFQESGYEAEDGLEQVRILRRTSGRVGVDFDRWIDVLLGPLLSSVDATVLAFGEIDGQWYALLGGDTPDGGWIAGIVDLGRSRFMLRPPRQMQDLATALLAP